MVAFIFVIVQLASKKWQNKRETFMTIPIPFGTRLVAHKRGALYTMRLNWVPLIILLIIFFSSKSETKNCEESSRWLRSHFSTLISLCTVIPALTFLTGCHKYLCRCKQTKMKDSFRTCKHDWKIVVKTKNNPNVSLCFRRIYSQAL